MHDARERDKRKSLAILGLCPNVLFVELTSQSDFSIHRINICNCNVCYVEIIPKYAR